MAFTKGSGQGSGGKGLLITALTAGTAQTLHTAVAGTATADLFRVLLVNNSAAGVQVTIRFEPDDASDAVEVTELIPAQSSAYTPIPDDLPFVINDSMVVKVYAATASAVSAWAIINDQSGANTMQQMLTGEVTLVQNTDAFRMNGVASSAVEADHQVLIPEAGTLTNLRAKALVNIGGGATVTVTVRVNGADTALSFTYDVADTTTLKSDGDSVAVAAGDLVTINFATDNAGAPAATMQGSLDFVPA
jgi:hypothetical protein